MYIDSKQNYNLINEYEKEIKSNPVINTLNFCIYFYNRVEPYSFQSLEADYLKASILMMI